jgi:hypothetical protein
MRSATRVIPSRLRNWMPGSSTVRWTSKPLRCLLSHVLGPDPWNSERGKLLPIIGAAKLSTNCDPLSEESAKAIASYLAEHAETLRSVHAVVELRLGSFPIDSTGTPKSPSGGWLRQAGRLLCLDTILRAEEGDSVGAFNSMRARWALVRPMYTEPLLVPKMASSGLQSLCLTSLRRTLCRVPYGVQFRPRCSRRRRRRKEGHHLHRRALNQDDAHPDRDSHGGGGPLAGGKECLQGGVAAGRTTG